MARRLETSLSETVRLVGCSSTVVGGIYRMWSIDGETKKSPACPVSPWRIDSERERRLLRIIRRV